MTHTTFFTHRAKLQFHVLSLLLIFATLLAACGTNTTAHKKAASTTLTFLANQTGDYPRNFNPFSSSVISGTQGMIYETLLYVNRLNGDIKPWLAESYDLASDAKSITFHLRKGVTWSDGQPFTSADVVFTLNLLKQYSALDLTGVDAYVQDVTAPDANTVMMTMNKPFFPITWLLGGQVYMLSKHHWSTVKGDASQYADPNPVGTGPYLVKSFTPQLVTLSKNPKFWQPGKPEVTEIKIPSYDSNTSSELALEKNQIDWTNLFIPNVDKNYVNLDKQHNHYWYPSSDIVMLYLNLKRYPFNLLPVRQAISDAIDRQQINKIGESGYEPPASPTSLLAAEKNFLDPQYNNLSFKVDTTQAAQLLESAGFKKGTDGIYADSKGKKLAFTLKVVNSFTDYVTDSALIAKDLQNIGIKVTVNQMSYDAYYNDLQIGNYDMDMLWTNAGPSPYYLYEGLLDSVNSAPIGQAASTNYERWQDPATDTLLNQYASSTDPATQQQSIMGLEKIMVEQLPSIPLVAEPYWAQYNTSKFTGWPDAQHPYAAPGTAEYPDIEYVVLNLHPITS